MNLATLRACSTAAAAAPATAEDIATSSSVDRPRSRERGRVLVVGLLVEALELTAAAGAVPTKVFEPEFAVVGTGRGGGQTISALSTNSLHNPVFPVLGPPATSSVYGFAVTVFPPLPPPLLLVTLCIIFGFILRGNKISNGVAASAAAAAVKAASTGSMSGNAISSFPFPFVFALVPTIGFTNAFRVEAPAGSGRDDDVEGGNEGTGGGAGAGAIIIEDEDEEATALVWSIISTQKQKQKQKQSTQHTLSFSGSHTQPRFDLPDQRVCVFRGEPRNSRE